MSPAHVDQTQVTTTKLWMFNFSLLLGSSLNIKEELACVASSIALEPVLARPRMGQFCALQVVLTAGFEGCRLAA